MKRIIFLSATLFLYTRGYAQESKTKVSVEVSQVKTKKGELFIAFFKPGSKFPEQDGRYEGKVVALGDKETILVDFEILPGEYAVAIFQDLNKNKKLDRNAIGIPKEPFGFSNNVKPKFSSPKFEECKFLIGTEPIKLKIDLLN